jgi:hypothetical protein
MANRINGQNIMSKYDEFFPRPPRKPFEPTPWLVVLILVMAIAFTSYLSQCGA